MHSNVTSSLANSNMDVRQLQSSTIDFLRFPLAIMVIFIHMNPAVVNLIDADFPLLSGHGFFNIIGIVLSHVLTHIAVPTFFFISGFLFFLNFPVWSWEGYRKKMESRVKTLLVPYILWNIVTFTMFIIIIWKHSGSMSDVFAMLQDKSWHVIYDYHEWGTTRINWLGENLKMTGPYDLPLWFLRDLIVVTILTPIIYYAIKKMKIGIVVILFLAYISRIWILVPGFHITAFFYFTLGAYFALNGKNIVLFVERFKFVFIPVSIILLISTTIYDGANTVIGQNIYPLFVCSCVFSAFYIAVVCIKKYHLKPNKLLVSSCFFIYAFHAASIPFFRICSPLALSQRILHQLIPGQSGIENGICYLTAPFLTAFLCIMILLVARKFFPKLTLFFSGNK